MLSFAPLSGRQVIISTIEALKRVAGALATAAGASAVATISPPWSVSMDKQQMRLSTELRDIVAKGYEIFFFVTSTNPIAILGNTGKFLDAGASNEDPGDQWYG